MRSSGCVPRWSPSLRRSCCGHSNASECLKWMGPTWWCIALRRTKQWTYACCCTRNYWYLFDASWKFCSCTPTCRYRAHGWSHLTSYWTDSSSQGSILFLWSSLYVRVSSSHEHPLACLHGLMVSSSVRLQSFRESCFRLLLAWS